MTSLESIRPEAAKRRHPIGCRWLRLTPQPKSVARSGLTNNWFRYSWGSRPRLDMPPLRGSFSWPPNPPEKKGDEKNECVGGTIRNVPLRNHPPHH